MKLIFQLCISLPFLMLKGYILPNTQNSMPEMHSLLKTKIISTKCTKMNDCIHLM